MIHRQNWSGPCLGSVSINVMLPGNTSILYVYMHNILSIQTLAYMYTCLNHHIPQEIPIYDSFKSMLIINYPREGAYVPTHINTMVYTYVYV